MEDDSAWDFVDPVDLISKLPGKLFINLAFKFISFNLDDYNEKIESKKWQERKEALEQLQALLTKHARLDAKGANYGALVDTLSRVVAKDANVNVVALAANCLALLVRGLRQKFTWTSSVRFQACRPPRGLQHLEASPAGAAGGARQVQGEEGAGGHRAGGAARRARPLPRLRAARRSFRRGIRQAGALHQVPDGARARTPPRATTRRRRQKLQGAHQGHRSLPFHSNLA